MRHRWTSILCTATALAACGQPAAPPAAPTAATSEPAFALIRQAPSPDRVELQALGGGMLALKDGCLRIDNPGNSRLLLWPQDAEQTLEGVFDPTTGSTVRIGEPIVIGGGEIDGVDPKGLADVIPPACTGPYWLGASGFFPAPKEEWQTVRIAEKFSIKVRQEMRPPAHPPSLPVTLSDAGLTLNVTEGKDMCDGPTADPQRKQWTFNVYSDLRMARVIRQKTDAQSEAIDAVFRGIDGPRGTTSPQGEICLRVHAQCATGRDCDHARSMLSTIRFGDLGTPD
jgi:hypothetical protein